MWKLKKVETENLLAVSLLTPGTVLALKACLGRLDMSTLDEGTRAQLHSLCDALHVAYGGPVGLIAKPICGEYGGPIEFLRVLTENPKRR